MPKKQKQKPTRKFTPAEVAQNFARQQQGDAVPRIAMLGKSTNGIQAYVTASFDWHFHAPLEQVRVAIPAHHYDTPGIEQAIKTLLVDSIVTATAELYTKVLKQTHGG